MTGLWLISYVVLWLLVLGGAVVVLILAREIESLQARLETVERQKRLADLEHAPARTSVTSSYDLGLRG